MRATFSGFNTALSALQANQKRLDIIGQNLANMNTPGYSRQQLETSSLGYTGPIAHYLNGSQTSVGYGVSMNTVSQIRNPYLDVQYRAQMSRASYTDSMQSSLDSLSRVLDESNTDGVRQALADIQSHLTEMQKSDNINDPVYESELRSRMQSLTNLLNSSANQIDTACKNEFDKLNGQGTSEQGSVQKVNDLLRQIGDLNLQIKQSQIMGQQSLEMTDQRNVLIDELSSYVPIDVSYFKDADHSGTYEYTHKGPDGKPVLGPDGKPVTEIRDRMYEYDSQGNVIGKKTWPDDLKVDLVFTDNKGNPQRLTLINGTEGGKGKNYGSVEMTGGSRTDPDKAAITFTGAAGSLAKPPASTVASAADSQFKDGAIQASLDMLGKAGTGGTVTGTTTVDDVRGYAFYMNKLDSLAETFANIINGINKDGIQGNPAVNTDPYHLLVNKTKPGDKITAANIGISSEWTNGSTHIGTMEGTDTVHNMLESMQKSQAGLGNKSFTDFIINTSTILANDSSANTNSLKTDVTVLNGVQNSRDSVSGISMDEEASNMMNSLSAYNAASRLMTALDEALNTLINSTGLVGR